MINNVDFASVKDPENFVKQTIDQRYQSWRKKGKKCTYKNAATNVRAEYRDLLKTLRKVGVETSACERIIQEAEKVIAECS